MFGCHNFVIEFFIACFRFEAGRSVTIVEYLSRFGLTGSESYTPNKLLTP